MSNQLDLFSDPIEPLKGTIAERIHERAKTAKIPIPGGYVKPKIKIKRYDPFKIMSQLKNRRESLSKLSLSIPTGISSNYTHKRAREAGIRADRKAIVDKQIQFFTNLIKAWDEENVPDYFMEIRNAKDWDRIYYGAYPRELRDPDDWYKEEREKDVRKAEKHNIYNQKQSTEAQELLKKFSMVYISPEEQKQIDLKKAIDNIIDSDLLEELKEDQDKETIIYKQIIKDHFINGFDDNNE